MRPPRSSPRLLSPEVRRVRPVGHHWLRRRLRSGCHPSSGGACGCRHAPQLRRVRRGRRSLPGRDRCRPGRQPRLPSPRQTGQLPPAPFLPTSVPEPPHPCCPVVTALPPCRRSQTADASSRSPCPGGAPSSRCHAVGPVVAQLDLLLRPGGLACSSPLPSRRPPPFWRRPAPFRPFNPTSPHCAALTAWWAERHDAAPGLWSPELQSLDAPFLAPVLFQAQRACSYLLADQRFAALLASAPPYLDGSRFRARLHFCACQTASIWLDSMPTSFPLTLFDSDFTSSARLRLGLPAGPAKAPTLQCNCGSSVLVGAPDHPLIGTCLALQRTS
jgi:hypothetical protein